LLVVAAEVGALIWWWERSLTRILVQPESSGGTRRRGTALIPRGFRAFLRPGRVGAIAAKDLRYLTREPKRLVGFVISVLLPVLIAITSSISFGHRPPSATVFVVCGIALLNGLSGANRFGMDGSASWMLITTGTRRGDARRDVLGGDVAAMLAATPVLLVVGLAAAGVSGSARNLPAALGLAFALLATMVGASGLVSVLAPYPVPESRNAFGAGSTGQGCAAGLYLFLALGGCVVGCLPLLLLLIPSFFSPMFGLALLVVGPLYGLALGEIVRRAAVRRWTDKAPEILQVVSSPLG
jgi:ABC-2 type transport system permease protein